jgi:hypothetical protein
MAWRVDAEVPALREPALRYTSLETEVWIPAAQAAIVALAWSGLAGLAVGGLAAWRGWPWWMVPLAMIISALALFAWRVTAHIAEHRARLWRREVAEGRDINGDGAVGRPSRRDPALVYVHDPGRERRRQAAADFRFFLREAYNGRGTTWRAWDGVSLPSGRKATRPLWEEYTDRLLRAGLAERPYPTAELELVGDYRTALEAFAEAL